MTHSQIIEIEKRNTNEELFKIQFYLEGEWWRAYEWSAYLCNMFFDTLEDGNKLKAKHKESKSSENGIVLVGLKLTSFPKYFPNISINKIDDKNITLDIREYVENDITVENYIDILDKWKGTIPFDKSKNKEDKCIIKEPSEEPIMPIMQEILAYPLAKKSLIDNILFISHLKDTIIQNI